MPNSVRITATAILYLCMLFTVGCTNTPSTQLPAQLPQELSGLKLVEKQLPNILYVREQGTSIAQYQNFYVPEVELLSQFNQESMVSSDDTGRLLGYFRERLVNELTQAGLPVVGKPQAESLTIKLNITALNKSVDLSDTNLSPLQGVFKQGSVTIVATFANTNTQDIEAIAIHNVINEDTSTDNDNISAISGAIDLWSSNVVIAINDLVKTNAKTRE